MYKLNYFNFKEREKNYLLTNDTGNFSFIPKEELNKLINRKELQKNIYQELIKKNYKYKVNKEILYI